MVRVTCLAEKAILKSPLDLSRVCLEREDHCDVWPRADPLGMSVADPGTEQVQVAPFLRHGLPRLQETLVQDGIPELGLFPSH